jgi:hypothetical protein
MSSTQTAKPGSTRLEARTSSTSRAKGASRQGVRTLDPQEAALYLGIAQSTLYAEKHT